MLEYEIKLPITKREYELLLELRETDHEDTHTNYYYDTDRLDNHRRGITCRIRERNGRFVATKKTHMAHGVSKEETSEVADVYDTSLFDKNVRLYGEMKTQRTVLSDNNGVVATLDKNTYLGMTDYELEIEYEPERRREAECRLKYYGEYVDSTLRGEDAIEFASRRSQKRSKSARFFDYYSVICANDEEVSLDEVIC